MRLLIPVMILGAVAGAAAGGATAWLLWLLINQPYSYR